MMLVLLVGAALAQTLVPSPSPSPNPSPDVDPELDMSPSPSPVSGDFLDEEFATFTISFLADGSVEDYTEAHKRQFAKKIAESASTPEITITKDMVTITITEASVLITAEIVLPAGADVGTIVAALIETMGTAELASAVLGINVLEDPSIVTPPAPPPPPQALSEDQKKEDIPAIVGGAVGGGVGLALLIFLYCYCCGPKKDAKKKPSASV